MSSGFLPPALNPVVAASAAGYFPSPFGASSSIIFSSTTYAAAALSTGFFNAPFHHPAALGDALATEHLQQVTIILIVIWFFHPISWYMLGLWLSLRVFVVKLHAEQSMFVL